MCVHVCTRNGCVCVIRVHTCVHVMGVCNGYVHACNECVFVCVCAMSVLVHACVLARAWQTVYWHYTQSMSGVKASLPV